jgi:hypothetical protein
MCTADPDFLHATMRKRMFESVFVGVFLVSFISVASAQDLTCGALHISLKHATHARLPVLSGVPIFRAPNAGKVREHTQY